MRAALLSRAARTRPIVQSTSRARPGNKRGDNLVVEHSSVLMVGDGAVQRVGVNGIAIVVCWHSRAHGACCDAARTLGARLLAAHASIISAQKPRRQRQGRIPSSDHGAVEQDD